MLVKFEVLCWQLHSITTNDVGYCIPFKIVLIMEWLLLLERVSSLILTGPPMSSNLFMHCVCAELISEPISSIMIQTYFVNSENVLIRKIISKELNQIF